jgi:hypothetical protein
MFMTLESNVDDIPTFTGIGRIDISTFPIQLPLFFIDLGENQSSLAPQFQQYNKITLTITPINPFSFRYEIHSDMLLFAITKEIRDRVDRGEKIEAVLSEYPREYAFQASLVTKLHWHTMFTDAMKESLGIWILLLRGATTNIILIDHNGNIAERVEEPRFFLPGADD